jgi:hypothetical protein
MTEFLTKDSALPPYLAFPRFLLDSGLNETAKLLYVVLLDRARVSQQNQGWTDDQGRVFLYYTIQDLSETLHKSDMTVKRALASLEQEGLVVRQHRGLGQANRIYVKCRMDSFPFPRQNKNVPSDGTKMFPLTEQKRSTNNNYLKRTREKQQKSNSGFPNYDCKEDESL